MLYLEFWSSSIVCLLSGKLQVKYSQFNSVRMCCFIRSPLPTLSLVFVFPSPNLTSDVH